jgi:hypothetical protein
MFKVRDLMLSTLPMTDAQMEEVLRDGLFAACDGGCSACTASCSGCTPCTGCTNCSVTCLSSGRVPLPWWFSDRFDSNLRTLHAELSRDA